MAPSRIDFIDRLIGSLLAVAVDVLDLDGGVIHENADRQRQPAKRHDVDGLAERRSAR